MCRNILAGSDPLTNQAILPLLPPTSLSHAPTLPFPCTHPPFPINPPFLSHAPTPPIHCWAHRKLLRYYVVHFMYVFFSTRYKRFYFYFWERLLSALLFWKQSSRIRLLLLLRVFSFYSCWRNSVTRFTTPVFLFIWTSVKDLKEKRLKVPFFATIFAVSLTAFIFLGNVYVHNNVSFQLCGSVRNVNSVIF